MPTWLIIGLSFVAGGAVTCVIGLCLIVGAFDWLGNAFRGGKG